MKYCEEFRSADGASALISELNRIPAPDRKYKVMEVCGGHTVSIFKYGIRQVLPDWMELVSGPGCPVCVTPVSYIDRAIALAGEENVIIASFGDLMRVPGTESSLLQVRAEGADVRMCYSPTDALKIAKDEPDQRVVFLGIGFETTAPTTASVVKQAQEQGLQNFYVLSAHKTMPNAMRALVSSGELGIDAFVCPGHVSTITGTGMYDFLTKEFSTPCVVSGFEPLDILHSLVYIARQFSESRSEVENTYSRVVVPEGNAKAQALLQEVFDEVDMEWRGFGSIPKSGLVLSDQYRHFDAEREIAVSLPESREHPGCICGEIMRGVKTPKDCSLFGTVCTPDSPTGPCMVSDEGSCATYFQYARES
jgi:hydrogenase expression/formation protein HypD